MQHVLLVFINIHKDRTTTDQRTKQQLLGQGTADSILNQPMHGTGPHCWIKPLLSQVLTQCVAKGYLYALFRELLLELEQEFVHYSQDHILIQCIKGDDRIQPVSEFRGK